MCVAAQTNCRYRQLTRANEHLAGQLKEAHEALFEVQTAVQATPVHKRREQTHLMGRLHDAEQVRLLRGCSRYALMCHIMGMLCVAGLYTVGCQVGDSGHKPCWSFC